MSRIPDSIDELLWLVAESNDPSARETFLKRYPHLQSELVKRMAVVSGLRGAKPAGASSIPPFRARHSAPSFSLSKAWMPLAASIALFSLGFAAYRAMSAPPTPGPSQSEIDANKGTRNGPSPLQNGPVGRPFSQQDVNSTSVQPSESPVTEQPVDDVAPPTPSSPTALSIKGTSIMLTDALKQIAQRANYKVTLAPGFEDFSVSFEFKDTEPISIFNQLGAEFGFTAIEQGPKELLLVPAIDPNAPKSASSDGRSGQMRVDE